MLRLFLLSISFLGCLSTAVPAAIESNLAKVTVEQETCSENARRNCEVYASTKASEFHSELRKFLGELPLGPRKKETAFGGFDLIRSKACLEMQIDHCAQAVTRGVYNAHRRQFWDMVVEKFEFVEPFNSEMTLKLMEEFERPS